MMDTNRSEQALRSEAIRRRLAGQNRNQICTALERATSWFDKWWAAYRRDPQTDFADRSRAPQRSPQQWSPEVEQMIVSIRRTREAGRTPETKYGFIGQRTIQGDLERLGVKPPPSLATIQRVLAAHDLTHPLGAAEDTAYYPRLLAWEQNAIHATDIITRHLRGGAEIQNFHTIDHFSQVVHLSQALDKTSTTVRVHLLENWADLGLPFIQQFDNEGAFCGGHTHPRVIGQVVRLCLFCGVEPLFIPEYEPKRNQLIETFHSVWLHGFWSRRRFRNLSHVQQEAPIFVSNYLRDYRPPSLEGRSPAQMRSGYKPVRLTAAVRTLLPEGRLPITAGHIHVIRKVDCQGTVSLLNETWSVGKKWMGEYIWSVIDTAEQTLTFWHRADAQSEWRRIKSRCFQLKEPVQPLLPQFYRNRTRCREHLPG
jgi:hypothetical protein